MVQSKLRFDCTVKRKYNDHPWDPKIVTFVERWSLFRSHLCYKNSKWNLKIVAVVDRWSLAQVRLYMVNCLTFFKTVDVKNWFVKSYQVTSVERVSKMVEIYNMIRKEGPCEWHINDVTFGSTLLYFVASSLTMTFKEFLHFLNQFMINVFSFHPKD